MSDLCVTDTGRGITSAVCRVQKCTLNAICRKKESFCPPHLLTREQNGSGCMLAVDVAQCESTHKIEITQVNYFELT